MRLPVKIKEKIGKKIKQTKGETLGETLIALLISALALVMLAGAVSASSGVVMKSKDKVNAYYAANENSNGVVKMQGAGTSASITITETTSGVSDPLSITPVPIAYYENNVFSNKEVIAYKYNGS